MCKKIFGVITSALILCLLLIVVDYFNLPSALGIAVSSLNWDYLSILIGNVIVIVLFFVTFLLIDHRNIKMNENQVRNARRILINSYCQCKEQIELFDNKYAAKMAAQKCNFNIPNFQDPVLAQIQNLPFELEQYILDASNGGVLSEKEFQAFLDIRKEYKVYIANRITFFDVDEHTDMPQVKHGLIPHLDKKRTELLECINEQLKNLQNNS